jgi:hypothetical protein
MFPYSGHADVGDEQHRPCAADAPRTSAATIKSPIVTWNPNGRRTAPSMPTMLIVILAMKNTFS